MYCAGAAIPRWCRSTICAAPTSLRSPPAAAGARRSQRVPRCRPPRTTGDRVRTRRKRRRPSEPAGGPPRTL